MHLTGRGGLARLGMTLGELGDLGYRIIADPTTPLLAAYATWKKVYAELAQGFGATAQDDTDWEALERDLFAVIGLEQLLAIERATVEPGLASPPRVS
jgi:2-methylisocitrate lyase-like PEP mutase family enzyme